MKYQETINGVREKVASMTIDPTNPFSDHRRNYLLVKANRTHLLNNDAEPVEFYRDLIYNQMLTEKENIILPDILDQVEVRGHIEVFKEARFKPMIFCPFHLGSFHSWTFLFAQHNLDFTAVINYQAYNDQRSKILDNMAKLNAKLGASSQLSFLNAEEPKIAINMIREIKNGKNLFIYIDGNSGVGGNQRTDGKLDKINFLGTPYNVRTGVAAISHLTETPIVPLVSYRENGRIILEVLQPILADIDMDRNQYAVEATQNLYDCLTPFLLAYPEQWEPWLYINHFIEPEKESIDRLKASFPKDDLTKIRFNRKRYGLLSENAKYCLFDTYESRLFTISESLFTILHDFGDNIGKRLGENLLNDLKINGVVYGN